MDIIIGMLVTFSILLFSINKGIFVGIPLVIGLFIFTFISWRRGFSLQDICTMSYAGGKKAVVVLKTFILIGAITALWMAAGTVPAIVYYGIKLMNPSYFILYAFLISSLVSFLLGTSLGTVSTVGLALIVMAKGGNVDLNIAAGAIIAGAYFGDRCSPMSSSANLVANLTETNIFTNIRNMVSSSAIPFIISIVLYTLFSLKQPLRFAGSSIDSDILNSFHINWLVLLPAILIVIFSVFKVNVKSSMLFSIFIAAMLSIFIQHHNMMDIINYLFFGFYLNPDNPLHSIIKGGGILSMWQAALVVYVSCSLAGIFDGTNMLNSVDKILARARTRAELFVYTTAVSIVTAAFGCNQSIATVLTNQLMTNTYKEKNIDKYTLALDLENTGIVLSALIPWNIAAFVPTTTMDVSPVGFVPYAFYLYLLPLVCLVRLKSSGISR